MQYFGGWGVSEYGHRLVGWDGLRLGGGLGHVRVAGMWLIG